MHITELWSALGDLEDHEAYQVLTQLFVRYEERREQQPEDPESATFFQALGTIMNQVRSCNVSRR